MTESSAERALREALDADTGDDYRWIDELPEVDELPDDPDATQALVIPTKE